MPKVRLASTAYRISEDTDGRLSTLEPELQGEREYVTEEFC